MLFVYLFSKFYYSDSLQSLVLVQFIPQKDVCEVIKYL